MGRSRKMAMEVINSHRPRVEEHLEKLRAKPNDISRNHWRGEVRGWLKLIIRMSRHVGQRTRIGLASDILRWASELEMYDEAEKSERN